MQSTIRRDYNPRIVTINNIDDGPAVANPIDDIDLLEDVTKQIDDNDDEIQFRIEDERIVIRNVTVENE